MAVCLREFNINKDKFVNMVADCEGTRFRGLRRESYSFWKSSRSEFVPEIIRFRRGYSFEKSLAYESRFRVGSSAELSTFMSMLRKGSKVAALRQEEDVTSPLRVLKDWIERRKSQGQRPLKYRERRRLGIKCSTVQRFRVWSKKLSQRGSVTKD